LDGIANNALRSKTEVARDAVGGMKANRANAASDQIAPQAAPFTATPAAGPEGDVAALGDVVVFFDTTREAVQNREFEKVLEAQQVSWKLVGPPLVASPLPGGAFANKADERPSDKAAAAPSADRKETAKQAEPAAANGVEGLVAQGAQEQALRHNQHAPAAQYYLEVTQEELDATLIQIGSHKELFALVGLQKSTTSLDRSAKDSPYGAGSGAPSADSLGRYAGQDAQKGLAEKQKGAGDKAAPSAAPLPSAVSGSSGPAPFSASPPSSGSIVSGSGNASGGIKLQGSGGKLTLRLVPAMQPPGVSGSLPSGGGANLSAGAASAPNNAESAASPVAKPGAAAPQPTAENAAPVADNVVAKPAETKSPVEPKSAEPKSPTEAAKKPQPAAANPPAPAVPGAAPQAAAQPSANPADPAAPTGKKLRVVVQLRVVESQPKPADAPAKP
jgi:Meckel syndrome type 1 protein